MKEYVTVEELADAYVECKTIGHSWDNNPTGVVDSALFRSSNSLHDASLHEMHHGALRLHRKGLHCLEALLQVPEEVHDGAKAGNEISTQSRDVPSRPTDPKEGDTKVNFESQPTFLGEAIVFRSESESRPGLYHYTFKLRRGGVICTCEGWQFQGHCKHVVDLPLDEAAQDIMKQWRLEHE